MTKKDVEARLPRTAGTALALARWIENGQKPPCDYRKRIRKAIPKLKKLL